MKINSISILGSGWLGFPLAEHFSSRGFTVKAATRSQERLTHIQQSMPELPIYQVDIAARQTIEDFLQSDCLIINITHKDIADFSWLIRQLEKSTVRTVLFISSTSVYPSVNRTVSEDEGIEKTDSPLWQIEQLFLQQQSFLTSVVRFGGLIDSRRQPGRFFRHGKKLQQPDARVNLIHLDDCIGVIETIIKKQAWGEVFNAVADSHPLKHEFYSEMAERSGLPAPEYNTPEKTEFKIISNDKIKSRLGYQLKHPDLLQIEFSSP